MHQPDKSEDIGFTICYVIPLRFKLEVVIMTEVSNGNVYVPGRLVANQFVAVSFSRRICSRSAFLKRLGITVGASIHSFISKV